jgi:SlyX protein
MTSELFAATEGSGHLEVHRCAACQGSWIQPPEAPSFSALTSQGEVARVEANSAANDNAPDDTQRMQELEIKLAYQDDLVETLNQVVIELRGELTALERGVKALRQQVSDTLPDDAPAHDPPPHY